MHVQCVVFISLRQQLANCSLTFGALGGLNTNVKLLKTKTLQHNRWAIHSYWIDVFIIFVEKNKILEIVQNSAVFFKHFVKTACQKNCLTFSREASVAEIRIQKAEAWLAFSFVLLFPSPPPQVSWDISKEAITKASRFKSHIYGKNLNRVLILEKKQTNLEMEGLDLFQ